MKYHSGSHLSSDLCIETASDVVLTVVVTVGQFGEPVKGARDNRELHQRSTKQFV